MTTLNPGLNSTVMLDGTARILTYSMYSIYAGFLLVLFVVMAVFSQNQPLKSRSLPPFLITIVIFIRVLATMCLQFDYTCAIPILSGLYDTFLLIIAHRSVI